MNVLYIATYEGLTGASYSLIGMINELKKLGITPFVILLKKGELCEKLEENKIPYTIIRGYPWVIDKKKKKNLKQNIFWIIKQVYNFHAEILIRNIISQKQINLVHINAFTAAIGFKASQKAGVSCVWHIREFVEEDLGKEFWNKTRALRYLTHVNKAIAISKSVKDKFIKMAPNANIDVVYNGISTLPFVKQREKPIFSNESICIIIAGRIDPGKGHKELIDALEDIYTHNHLNIFLEVVGSSQYPEYEKDLKEYVNCKNLDKIVYFLGYRNDLPELFKEADISIVASKSEAFGRVTVESMMGGALVIGSNTAGTEEILENKYGLLYEQGRADDLAKKILYAIHNKKQMRKIAENGCIYALQNFTAERNAKQIFDEYQELCGN